MAVDYLGQELHVGDTVVFEELKYRHFETGIIAKITPKKVRIEYTSKKWGYESEYVTYQEPKQVIKVPLPA